ncbi:MAG TPA: DUF1330 domain-containing protein [Ktedonobacteraceae bacterium]|nr:DUF1330 domain-containing protein [Ktedonobacteraceae bacterium]
MAVYIVAEQEIIDPEGYREYQRRVVPTILQYGGKVLAAGKPVAIIEGNWHPKRVLILEFESLEQVNRWYNSEEYTAIKDIRLKSALTQGVVVQGLQ